jgi:phosphatidate cytidylyltransferase
MNSLLTRSITGVLFISVVLFSILWSPYAQTIVFSGFAFMGLLEFYKLFKTHPIVNLSRKIGLFFGMFIFTILVGWSLNWFPLLSLLIIFPLFFTLLLAELWRKKEQPLLNIAVMTFGILYTVIPFWLTIDLNLRETGENFMPLIIGMYLLIWSNDTFAYLFGSSFGKTKLFERISPKKTWEGTLGGVISTVLVGLLIGLYINEGNILFWVISAGIIAPCAIFGDLLESLFKRSMDVKDTGRILPGHGGVLDRFDAALFAAPFFYCWALFYNHLF